MWSGARPALDCDGLRRSGQAAGPGDRSRKQIADPDSVFQLVTMMQGVVQRGTGIAAGARA